MTRAATLVVGLAVIACAASDADDTHGGAQGSSSVDPSSDPSSAGDPTGDDPSVGTGVDPSTSGSDAHDTTAAPTTDDPGGSSDTGAPVGPITCRTTGDGITTITFVNQCDGVLSYRGSLVDGGELEPGAHACHDIGDVDTAISAIRYWGFVGADPGGEHHTLAELTLNTDFNDFDWYNISHVDAHNLPMTIVPVDRPDCRTLSCPDSLLAACPDVGRFEIDGTQVACVSPDRDNPDSPVAQYFEAACADAYSWSGDDAESVVACAAEDFDVVFCP